MHIEEERSALARSAPSGKASCLTTKLFWMAGSILLEECPKDNCRQMVIQANGD